MAQRIDQLSCTKCGVCIEECPNGGIEEVDGEVIVLPSLCTECYGFYATPRCMEVCPADAVEPDPTYLADDMLNAVRASERRPDRFPRD